MYFGLKGVGGCMEKKSWWNSEIAFYCKLILTAAGVYLVFRYGLPLFAPFVAAYLLAAAVRPLVRFLKRKCHIPSVISASFLLTVLICSLVFLLFFLGKLLFVQISLFLKNYTGIRADFFLYAEKLCCCADDWFRLKDGTAMGMFESRISFAGEFIQTKLMPQMSEASLSLLKGLVCFFGKVVFAIVAALIILSGVDSGRKKKRQRKNPLSGIIQPGLKQILTRLSDTGVAFLKTQGILISLVAFVCTIGFFFVKPEYALLFGILVAVVDAFPILGSGIVLVPYAVVSLFQGKVLSAVVLFIMYLSCLLIRQLLEPKLLGDKIGLSALSALIAVYVGVELFGILGIVLGPFLFVILQTVLEEMQAGRQDEDFDEE